MKRILALLLLLVYSAAVSGATFHLHYCADYLESVSITGPDHDGCCCEKAGQEMRRAENCCNDVVVTIKSDDDHNRSEVATIGNLYSLWIPAIFPAPIPVSNTCLYSTSRADLPPLVRRTIPDELFILHCTFRI